MIEETIDDGLNEQSDIHFLEALASLEQLKGKEKKTAVAMLKKIKTSKRQ